MRQRPAGTTAGSGLVLVAVSVIASAGLLGSIQPAGALTPPAVPGAPTGVSASPEPGGADVNWSPPSSDGGASITQYKILATDLTDPARGGQTAQTKGYVGQIIHGLTVGDRYTLTVRAANSAGTGPASAPSNAVVPTPPAPPRGVYCKHVSGTTGDDVKLSSCRPVGGGVVGTGMLHGAVLKGTARGTISWRLGRQLSSTTIAVKTTLGPDPTKGWCVIRGLGREYDVSGKVTANTQPDIAVGQAVSGYICISSAGAVKQSHYGRFTL